MQEIKQEKSPIKQRILQYLGKKGISMYDCYIKTGITRGILGQNNGISEDNIAKFLAYYTDVNTEWLILGHGSMFRDNKISEENTIGTAPNVIPISPVEESIIYKMYKEKDEENKKLIEEIGSLKERIRQLESQNKESDCPTAASLVTEAFTSESYGDYGEDSLPMKPSTTSKRSSAGKM